MAGMTLYTPPGFWRSYPILIAAEYSNVALTVVSEGPEFCPETGRATQCFLNRFPQGKVPVLVADSGFCVQESNAAAYYVSSDVLRGPSRRESVLIQQWINFAENELIPPVAAWVFPTLGIRKSSKLVTERAKEDVKKVLSLLNDHLHVRMYLVGEHVTLADITLVCAMLGLYKEVLEPSLREQYADVNRWFTTCVNQPPFQRVLGEVRFCEPATQCPARKPSEARAEQDVAKEAARVETCLVAAPADNGSNEEEVGPIDTGLCEETAAVEVHMVASSVEDGPAVEAAGEVGVVGPRKERPAKIESLIDASQEELSVMCASMEDRTIEVRLVAASRGDGTTKDDRIHVFIEAVQTNEAIPDILLDLSDPLVDISEEAVCITGASKEHGAAKEEAVVGIQVEGISEETNSVEALNQLASRVAGSTEQGTAAVSELCPLGEEQPSKLEVSLLDDLKEGSVAEFCKAGASEDEAPVEVSQLDVPTSEEGPVEVSQLDVSTSEEGPVEVSQLDVSTSEEGPVEVSQLDVPTSEEGPVEVSQLDVPTSEEGPVEVSQLDVPTSEEGPVEVSQLDVPTSEEGPVEVSQLDVPTSEEGPVEVSQLDVPTSEEGPVEVSQLDVPTSEEGPVEVSQLDVPKWCRGAEEVAMAEVQLVGTSEKGSPVDLQAVEAPKPDAPSKEEVAIMGASEDGLAREEATGEVCVMGSLEARAVALSTLDPSEKDLACKQKATSAVGTSKEDRPTTADVGLLETSKEEICIVDAALEHGSVVASVADAPKGDRTTKSGTVDASQESKLPAEETMGASRECGDEWDPIQSADWLKAKDPFACLPKSVFVLDEFKQKYSNEDISSVALPYFWDHFDKEGWSVWYMEYKYPQELSLVMSSNLITGMFQCLDGLRKHGFASVILFGTDGESSISGIWILRGQQHPSELNEDWQVVCEMYSWKKLAVDTDECKEMVNEYFTMEGTFRHVGKPFNQGKIFK